MELWTNHIISHIIEARVRCDDELVECFGGQHSKKYPYRSTSFTLTALKRTCKLLMDEVTKFSKDDAYMFTELYEQAFFLTQYLLRQ